MIDLISGGSALWNEVSRLKIRNLHPEVVSLEPTIVKTIIRKLGPIRDFTGTTWEITPDNQWVSHTGLDFGDADNWVAWCRYVIHWWMIRNNLDSLKDLDIDD